jgi:hypothetical protein
MSLLHSPRAYRTVATVLVLLGVIAALGAVPAEAAGPTIIDETITAPVPIPFALGCQDPDFDVLITSLTIDRRRILYYDDAGNLIREIRHVAFTGSLTNAVTGRTVPYDGHFTYDFAYVGQTLTLTGLGLRVHVPGEGVLALRTGRAVISGFNPTQDIVTEVGHTLEEFQTDLCASLA